MKIYPYSLRTFGGRRICIGKHGENLATRIDVDVTPWKTEYPTGTISLFVVPPVGNGYLAALEENGNTVSWVIRDTDTASIGSGKAELILKDTDGTVIKSATAYTTCIPSVSSSEPSDPPEAIRPWVEQILDAIASGALAGIGIESLEQTTISTDDSGINVWTATLTDGSTYQFEVRNGQRGEKGLQGEPGSIESLTINGKTPDAGGAVTLEMGDIDGLSDAIANAGGVKTVAGVGPDSAGNVPLTAEDVGAATAEEVSALKSDLDNWFFTENGVNIFDPDSIEENIMIAISSKEPHKNFGYSTGKKDYFVTDFIPVQNGDTIRLSNVCVNIGFFADRDGTTAQDENGFYGLVNINEWTATNDIRFIRLTFYEIKKSVQSMMITKNAVIPFEYKKYFSNEDRLSYDLMEGYARKRIDIYASDSEETIIQKMIEAFKFQNCDVCFERAHYGFGPELVQMTTKYDMYMNEIPIGNGCRYYFNGATLEAEINEEDTEFYCNLLGSQKAPSSFELYDGILIATDTRYVVHDESSSMSGSFRHVYRNMRMEYKTNRRTDVLRKCIGGGTGVSGVIDIEGCTFITDGTTPCVSYHGNEVAGAPESEFNVNIRNSYLSNHFGAGELADNQKGILFYSHNSSVSEPTVLSDTWKVVKFGNEIRGQ